MTKESGLWSRIPWTLRAIVSGFVIALIGIYGWGAALFKFGVPTAIPVTLAWLALYLVWTYGNLPPGSTRVARRRAARPFKLTGWGILAALAFAVTAEASLVVLFRLVPFPREAFRHLSPPLGATSPAIIWATIVTAALVASVCEEMGFRGYMQQPIEAKHGAVVAILISSAMFTVFHLNQAWATTSMLPLIFGLGTLLGLLAWSSGSLLPGILGHAVMDVANFAYWWTGYAGDFTQATIGETGIDTSFKIEAGVLGAALLAFLFAVTQLRRQRGSSQ